MSVVIGQVTNVLDSYLEGRVGLQSLVNAVEILRDSTEVFPAEVDQIYMDLEVINAIRLDENRALSSDENKKINILVKKLRALVSQWR